MKNILFFSAIYNNDHYDICFVDTSITHAGLVSIKIVTIQVSILSYVIPLSTHVQFVKIADYYENKQNDHHVL